MQKTDERVLVVMGGNLWMYVADNGAQKVMEKFGVDRETALEAISQRFLRDPQLSSGFLLCTMHNMPTEVEDFTDTNPCCIVVPEGTVIGMTLARNVNEEKPTDEWLLVKQRFDERLMIALSVATVSLLQDYSVIHVCSQEKESVDDVMKRVDNPIRYLEMLFDNPISHNGNGDVLRRFSYEWRQVKKNQDKKAARRLLRKVLLHLDKEGIVL